MTLGLGFMAILKKVLLACHMNIVAPNVLWSKLEIIHHLALTKRKDTHFSGVDNLNDFKDKIVANLGTKSNAWKSETEYTTAPSTSGGSWKRQVATIVGGLVQLAGFALSVFNCGELTSIRDSLEETQTESKYVASKVTEA